MQNRWLQCSLFLALALSRTVWAADDQPQCQEQIPRWVPTEYFGPGIIVRYEGHWYKSRLLQTGNEPGGTNMFAWEAVKAPPHCATDDTANASSSATTASNGQSNRAERSATAAADTPSPQPTEKTAVNATPKRLPTDTDDARQEAERRLDAQSAKEPKPANSLVHALGLDKQNNKDKPLTKKVCSQVTHWSFADSYTVGSLVSFRGQFYRSIRPTTGDMPSKSMPPHWEQINLPCSPQ